MLQPIGIYKGELYLVEDDFNGTHNMYVLRYITIDDLDYRRSYTGTREFVEDIWREDVYNNGVTCSLDEYVEMVMNDEIIDDEVGTWEASGFYTPKAKFDFVINEELAELYYKATNIQ